MKSKTTTYILLAGVIFIWGLVFYNIFTGLNANADTTYAPTSRKVVQNIETKEEDAFVLLANYRDPFLGGTVQPQTNSNVQSLQKVKKVVKPVKAIDWSFIDYVGIITNKTTNKKVGLINISGTDYMVNEGDVINGVTILKKDRDSVQVLFSDQKAWVRR